MVLKFANACHCHRFGFVFNGIYAIVADPATYGAHTHPHVHRRRKEMKTKKSSINAYVVYKTEEEAKAALQLFVLGVCMFSKRLRYY